MKLWSEIKKWKKENGWMINPESGEKYCLIGNYKPSLQFRQSHADYCSSWKAVCSSRISSSLRRLHFLQFSLSLSFISLRHSFSMFWNNRQQRNLLILPRQFYDFAYFAYLNFPHLLQCVRSFE